MPLVLLLTYVQYTSESMSQVFAFLLKLINYARTKEIAIPAVAAYDDVCDFLLCVVTM
jgi:hypothetical protein